jgi:hypothetical protein
VQQEVLEVAIAVPGGQLKDDQAARPENPCEFAEVRADVAPWQVLQRNSGVDEFE